jgi:hypothetical protein
VSLAGFCTRQRDYQRIFVEAHGLFPHACYFCGQPVGSPNGRKIDRWTAVVHHLDEDRTNSAPDNLVAAHWGCHSTHHLLNMTPDRRAKIRAAQTGRTPSPETRARISAALTGRKVAPEAVAKMRGKPKSPEHIAKMRAARRGKLLSPEHSAAISAGLKGHAVSPETRARISAAKRAMPHVCCLGCHRQFRVGGALALHLRACHGPR